MTRPATPAPGLAVVTPSSDMLLEDAAIANELSLSLLHNNPTPSPSVPPFQTPPSSGRIDGFLKDICEFAFLETSPYAWPQFDMFLSRTVGTPVHPTATFDVHDACHMPPSSSLGNLEAMEDMSLLMDQSAPPSPIGSPTHFGLPIPLFQDVFPQVRTRRVAQTTQQDQVPPSTKDPGIVSAAHPGGLETSMSLGRIADFLGDICACFGSLTPLRISYSFPCLGAPPVHKFSNRVRFEESQVANLTSSTTSSVSAIHIPEDMPYLVDRYIPSASVETSPGPAFSVPSFKDLTQNLSGTALPPDAHSTSKPRSLLNLGSPCISGPSRASLVSPRPRSGSDGSSFFMEVPENMTLLCEESLADLSGDDNFFFC